MALTQFGGSADRRDAIALTSLVGIWIAFLWNAFDPARSFALYMDNEFFVGTVLSAMSGAFSGGEWPLRMTTVLGGVPTYNLAQLSSFYPFYFAPLPIFETPIDAAQSMHWITLLHLLIFAVNMFILLRVIGTTRVAAVTGATVVAFGANSLAYAVWMNIVAPYAWLPLYLAGLIGVLENRNSTKYSAMAIFAVVLLALASPSQPLIHAVLVTGVLVVARWWACRSTAESKVTSVHFFKLAAIAVIAFLLAAPAVLPAVAEFKNMIRWIGPYPAVTGFERIPFDAFLIDQLSIAELGGVLVKITQHGVGSQYVGPIAISLAMVGLISRTRSWIAFAMAAIAVYSLASSAGANLGLAYINYILPLVNKIREPSRFLFLFQLAIGILAALGIDEVRRIASSALPWRASRRSVALVAAVAVVSLAAAFALRGHGAAVTPALIASGLLVTLVVITVFAARTQWRWRGQAVGLCWSAAALAILATNVSWSPPPISASHYLASDAVALDIAINRVANLDPQHDYRLIFEGNIDKQMAAMLASYKNVRTLNSYFNPAPLRQFQELYHHGPRTDNYLQILGARYLLCRDCAGTEYRGFKFRETINGYDLHEAPDALPHVQIVQRVDGRFDGLADFVGKAADRDLGQGLLFVESGAAVALEGMASRPSDCVVRNDVRKNNQMRYLVSCRSPGVLVLNEFYASPWQITVDGKKSGALQVNGNQIGVLLDRGAHVVEFTYRPWTFRLSIVLAAMGALLLFLWVLHMRRERPN